MSESGFVSRVMSHSVKEMKWPFEVCEDGIIQSWCHSLSAAVFDRRLLMAVQHEKSPFGTAPDRCDSCDMKSRCLIHRSSAKREWPAHS